MTQIHLVRMGIQISLDGLHGGWGCWHFWNYYNMGERTKGLPLQLCTKGILYFISNDIPLQIRSIDVKVIL